MSQRRVPTEDTALRDKLREFEQRLYRIENGGPSAGQVSFGPSIIVGDLQIDAVPVGADDLEVRLTNLNSGSTYTIPILAAP